ncbi:MAG TPA: condensation domain-containing protein, partial [Chitinophagaceae bacterium]|nr:condensation domain-containing protein [Chitinophagaceae bacterium]
LKDVNGHQSLVAYYVSPDEVPEHALRHHLSERLPDYMIPSYYVRMDSMPITESGKLNRKALPEPALVRNEMHNAPVTAEEKLLAGVWSKVLGTENISVTDKFFSLGGDSIKSIQISSRMRSLGYQVSVKDIFTSQTIKELAPKMQKIAAVTDQSLVTGPVVLTPVQQWLLNGPAVHKHHYNQSVMLHFTQDISAGTVRRIFEKITLHHDALRMVFRTQGNKIVQENLADMPVFITEHDLRNSNEIMESLADQLQSGIDLANGPLMKLGLFHQQDGSRLLIVVHHLVIDAVSWRILFEDIETLYRQVQQNMALSLPAKTLSFQSWAAGARGIDAAMMTDVPAIKRDYEDGDNLVGENVIATFTLSEENTSRLLKEAHAAFSTQMNDILLAALLLSIKKQFGLNQLLVDLEGHGRDESVSRTIGWFTVISPVLLEYAEELPNTLRHVKETLRKIPANRFGISGARIKFNYLGQFDADIDSNSFAIATDPKGYEVSPRNSREYDWDLIGMVKEGQLQMQLPYSPKQYRKETIDAFMTAYRQSLLELIAFCCAQEQKVLSPSDLSYKELSIQQLDALQQRWRIEDVYPLSPMQEGMLFHSLIDTGQGHYFEQKILTLKGRPDPGLMQESLEQLVQRYAVLRTAFVYKGYERPLQVVLAERKPTFHFYDLRSACAAKGSMQVIEQYRQEDRAKAFDLCNDPLVRVMILQTGEEEFELIWSHHHILMDGWCMGIIFRDLIDIYKKKKNSLPLALPPVKPYSNYIEWLESRDRNASVQYWKEQLQGYETAAGFPRKEIVQVERSHKPQCAERLIDAEKASLIYQVATDAGVTINTILQAAWGILLAKYNNTNDVVFGSVVSGRPAEIPGVENMVGLFINTIPVRITAEPEHRVAQLLGRVQEQSINSAPHHYHSLTEIQSLSALGRELLDHIMVFENYPISHELKHAASAQANDDIAVTDVRVHEQTNYDLVLVIIPGSQIQLKIDYNAAVYSEERIGEILQCFDNIIEQVIRNPQACIQDLETIPIAERDQLLQQLDNTTVSYPFNTTVTALFEAQVKRTPHRVAVQFENDIITYDALDKRSNKLAMLLRDHGVKPDQVVGLLMDRSMDTVVAMLAILKAGGAYLPIDIDYPRERIEYLIHDSKTKILLTSKRIDRGIQCKALTLYIEDAPNVAGDIPELENVNKPSDLCYIIYTSGTTGNPKGVMVEHRNVVRLFFNDRFQFRFDENDVWTMFHSPCFDFSVWEMYGALLFGGKVIVIPKMMARDTRTYFSLLHREGVTVLNQTPSAFYNLAQEALQQQSPPLALRCVIFGGEALSPRKLKSWRQHYPHVQLVNMFGITETTVHVTYKEIGDHEIE